MEGCCGFGTEVTSLLSNPMTVSLNSALTFKNRILIFGNSSNLIWLKILFTKYHFHAPVKTQIYFALKSSKVDTYRRFLQGELNSWS